MKRKQPGDDISPSRKTFHQASGGWSRRDFLTTIGTISATGLAWLPTASSTRSRVPFARFIQDSKRELLKLKGSPFHRTEFAQFAKRFGIQRSEINLEKYLIGKNNFEAYRCSGYMRFGYVFPFINREVNPNVTLEYLNRHGFKKSLSFSGRKGMYSIMECDTGAAFYAYVSQAMGLDSGLVWPNKVHCIAYSVIDGRRIPVPITPLDSWVLDTFGRPGQVKGSFGPVNPVWDKSRWRIASWRKGQVANWVPADFYRAYFFQHKAYFQASGEALQYLRHAREVVLTGYDVPLLQYSFTPRRSEDFRAIGHFLKFEGQALSSVNHAHWQKVANKYLMFLPGASSSWWRLLSM